ncbi:hypothetical protein GQ54DRAFT_299834, partial [Martensiomyces pterosporus]
SPNTVTNWIKATLQSAGINAKPHSTRHASSTRARNGGCSIDDIKLQAHWSPSSSTFEDF